MVLHTTPAKAHICAEAGLVFSRFVSDRGPGQLPALTSRSTRLPLLSCSKDMDFGCTVLMV